MNPIKVAVNSLFGLAGYRAIKIKNEPNQPTESKKPIQDTSGKTPSPTLERRIVLNQYKRFQSKYTQYARTHPVVKLHFGCGPRVLKDWINVDLDFEPFENYLKYYTDEHYPESIRGSKADFFALNITKSALPIPDNSVDIIFHEDFFEHISQRDQVAFLAETLRVMKKGAIHRINTPDLLQSMNSHSDFPKGFKGVYFGEWDSHQHLNVITQKVLEELALMVGYSKVVFNKKNGSTSKMIPTEYRPDPNDRPVSGNVYADLIK